MRECVRSSGLKEPLLSSLSSTGPDMSSSSRLHCIVIERIADKEGSGHQDHCELDDARQVHASPGLPLEKASESWGLEAFMVHGPWSKSGEQ